MSLSRLCSLICVLAALSAACTSGTVPGRDRSDGTNDIAADTAIAETAETGEDTTAAGTDATDLLTVSDTLLTGDAPTADLVTVDSSSDDATLDANADVAPQLILTRYRPSDGIHSRITPSVLAAMSAIVSKNAQSFANRFIKVGDSITDTEEHLYCFSSDFVDLDGRDYLQPTIDVFDVDLGDGTTSFNRDGEAMLGGKTAAWVIDAKNGDPSPLSLELTAVQPRFAVVMFGTNDIGYYDIGLIDETLRWFTTNYSKLVDQLIAAGVVPLLMAIPPRTKLPERNSYVPALNAVVRGIAEARQVPFVDYHRAMLPLPDFGLWPDGIHPNVYYQNGLSRGCVFTAAGLQKGHTVRNLVTIEALDRARRALAGDQAVLSPQTDTPRQGTGTKADPIVIDGLPFTDTQDTSLSAESNFDSYTGCSATQDESGPEVVYRLELSQAATLRAMVVSDVGADIDVHLLSALNVSSCLKRGHKEVTAQLAAGTYYLVLDSFVSNGTAKSGRYQLIVHRCIDNDPYCP